MTNASVNDPCECGQTTIRGCADMPSRHCGAWEQTTPPAFTAHELSALAEQGMTLTEAEEATVREARGQTVQHEADIDKLIAEMRAGLKGVTPAPWITGASRRSQVLRVQTTPLLIAETIDAPDAAHIARCSPANIAALLDEIERLRADNARLREALAPFVAVVLPASHWQSGWPDYAPLDTAMGSGRAPLTIGDCRRARTATETSNENQ
jgi:hypothetical protein